ncbi:hypothetical protein [Paenibacillus sp. ATY16]|nr:hypothetical protein [Paenibacillus sp. ATY16]
MKNQLKGKVAVILIIITCCILLFSFWLLFNMVDAPDPLNP